MKLRNALWDYAVQLYGQSGVEQACLALQQDCSLNVNHLLFCCWLATEGRSLQPRSLKASSAWQWQQSIVAPLRALRYQVRAPAQQEPELAACYQALREAELACEQVDLARLFALGRDWPASAAVRCDELMLHNLCLYLRLAQVDSEPRLLAALQVLVQAALGQAPARRVLQLQW